MAFIYYLKIACLFYTAAGIAFVWTIQNKLHIFTAKIGCSLSSTKYYKCIEKAKSTI